MRSNKELGIEIEEFEGNIFRGIEKRKAIKSVENGREEDWKRWN